jgi:hypothetical protein
MYTQTLTYPRPQLILSSERLKREKWVAEQTARIKETTIKGLEPEVQRILAQHQAQLQAAQRDAAEVGFCLRLFLSGPVPFAKLRLWIWRKRALLVSFPVKERLLFFSVCLALTDRRPSSESGSGTSRSSEDLAATTWTRAHGQDCNFADQSFQGSTANMLHTEQTDKWHDMAVISAGHALTLAGSCNTCVRDTSVNSKRPSHANERRGGPGQQDRSRKTKNSTRKR